MRNILIAIMGRTPQVVTEMLYALMVQRGIAIDAVYLMTTAEGKKLAVEKLLSGPDGKFFAFCKDYHLDPNSFYFNKDTILVASDLMDEIADIRNGQDSERFSELVMQFLKKETALQDTILHCSLSGGRKTMSVYLALGLQFYARAQDRLYHILVSPPEFENNPEFYYPPPKTMMIKRNDGKEISTAAVKIDLVEVPFIKLRSKIENIFGMKAIGYRQMVEEAQNWIEESKQLPLLILERCTRSIKIGKGQPIRLRAFDFAIYLYFVKKRLDSIDYPTGNDNYSHFILGGKLFEEEIAQEMANVYGQRDKKIRWEDVQQSISRIKKILREYLKDDPSLSFYEISQIGTYFMRSYGLKLPKSKLVIT